MKTTVIVTHQFTAFHSWPEAPTGLLYLRDLHRHVFHVKVGMVPPVQPGDMGARIVEFHTLQTEVANACMDFPKHMPEVSCEQMACHILSSLRSEFFYPYPVWCEVWEDNENGARVELDKDEPSPWAIWADLRQPISAVL